MTSYLVDNEEEVKPQGMRGTGFYSNRKWIEVRDFIKRRDKMTCQSCGEPITGRYIVDHIKEVNETNVHYWDIAYNPENLQLLCQSCHNAKTFSTVGTTNETFW